MAHNIIYATGSPYKRDEMKQLLDREKLPSKDGNSLRISDLFSIQFSDVTTEEPLERDLSAMVLHKAKSAYRSLLVPCMVEHAGLILADHLDESFPGGLTQPMWDALGPEGFLSELTASGRDVIARAVVGYCDGSQIQTFVGETKGKFAQLPRGNREFYWDTVFVPDEGSGLTFAEIADGQDGLARKIELSQSAKAMRFLFQSRSLADPSLLFPDY